MRIQNAVGVVVLFSALSSCTHAVRPIIDTAGFDQQVRLIDDHRIEALLQGDVTALNDIYSDDYTLVTATGVPRTKADQLAEIRSSQIRYASIQVVERVVRTYGDTAVVVSRDVSAITRGSQQVGGDFRFTRVYKQFGPKIRLIASHASPTAAAPRW